MHDGFTFANDTQWLASFSNLDALIAAFKPNGQVLCASAYFSNSYDHCDFSDVKRGSIWNSPLAAVGLAHTGYGETFLVRADAAAVPEPASLALLGLGLIGVVAARRKQQQ